MENFAAASQEDILQLLVQLAALLAAARLLGELAQRLRLPAVVGEMLAGVLLGPSLLSGFVPEVGRWIVPHTAVQAQLLDVVSLLGVMLLLVLTGLETDLHLIRRRARTALGAALGGLVLPFASGLALGYWMPADLLVDPSHRAVFALFLATSLSISAIPVLAKILMDLGLMRREVGQTMLAAGMLDDIVGWTLLGIVTALAGAGSISLDRVALTIGTVLLFVVLTATVGTWMVKRGMDLVQNRLEGRDRQLTLVVTLAFAWGAVTQALRLEPVIGAFAVGILFGRLRRLPVETVSKLEGAALAVFAPIFFAVAGLRVDVVGLLQPRLALITAVVISVATAGKVLGVYLGARLLGRRDRWSAIAYSWGLNARGALSIIVSSIGLSLGIIGQEVFSVVVAMAVVTSLIAPFALRLTLARVPVDEEESRRLEREEAAQGSLVDRVRRILLPIRPRVDATVEYQALAVGVIRRLGAGRKLGVTLFSSIRGRRRPPVGDHLARVRGLLPAEIAVTSRTVSGHEPVGAIIREAARDYDLVVMGTPDAPASEDFLFGEVVDDVVRLAPCPTVVVRGRVDPEEWTPRKILVPTDGGPASRRAAELAFALAGDEAVVAVVHVVTPETSPVLAVAGTTFGPRHRLGRDMTDELGQLGASLGVSTRLDVRDAPDPETGILSAAADFRPDLMILGTAVRAGTTRLFLGPRVERLVERAPCPVLVFNE